MDDRSAIVAAIAKGELDQVRALLALDSTLAATVDEHGVSIVMLALYHRQSEILQSLLAAKPALNLFEAASIGKTARMAEVLEEDPSLVSAYSADGFTALHFASFFGQEAAATFLLERGADIAAVSRNAMKVMPLHSAVTGRISAIVRALLEHHAPVNACQQHGWTPLHAAAQNGDRPSVEVLLQHGADPTLSNDDGVKAADLASKSDDPSLVALLS